MYYLMHGVGVIGLHLERKKEERKEEGKIIRTLAHIHFNLNSID